MDSRIGYLISKELQRELSAVERMELQAWIAGSEANRRWYDNIRHKANLVNDILILEHAASEEEETHAVISWRRELERQDGHGGGRVVKGWFTRPLLMRVAAALVIVLAAGALWQYLVYKRAAPGAGVAKQYNNNNNDVAPGTNKAILTLANGSRIVLDSAGEGALARQGNTQVLKLDSGEIAYRAGATGSVEALYNTITTPKGGQYKLILPDGSRVWLNAATTLRFPIAFTGAERSVELVSGEAYFEVEHHAAQPFMVHVLSAGSGDKELSLQVLGTSFDINAYPDEPETEATLLTGSVRVSKGASSVLLHPGEQAATASGGEAIGINRQVDVAGTVAWKDGLFSFDRAGIKVVMRQLARWYDVEVGYEGAIPSRQFVGSIPRNVPASVVLKALEYNNVHFRIEGKKIIVTP